MSWIPLESALNQNQVLSKCWVTLRSEGKCSGLRCTFFKSSQWRYFGLGFPISGSVAACICYLDEKIPCEAKGTDAVSEYWEPLYMWALCLCSKCFLCFLWSWEELEITQRSVSTHWIFKSWWRHISITPFSIDLLVRFTCVKHSNVLPPESYESLVA